MSDKLASPIPQNSYEFPFRAFSMLTIFALIYTFTQIPLSDNFSKIFVFACSGTLAALIANGWSVECKQRLGDELPRSLTGDRRELIPGLEPRLRDWRTLPANANGGHEISFEDRVEAFTRLSVEFSRHTGILYFEMMTAPGADGFASSSMQLLLAKMSDEIRDYDFVYNDECGGVYLLVNFLKGRKELSKIAGRLEALFERGCGYGYSVAARGQAIAPLHGYDAQSLMRHAKYSSARTFQTAA